MNILLLAGSPSVSSRSTRLLHHVGDSLALLGHRNTRLPVSDLSAQALLLADFNHPDIRRARAAVENAEAVVISTPVYQAAYSGVLKAFLDILPQNALAGKLILPLATGGSQSHMLALDYALRPVLSALAADHVLPSIYATEAQIAWNAETGLTVDPAIAKRIQDGVNHLSSSLYALHGRSTAAQPALADMRADQVRCNH